MADQISLTPAQLRRVQQIELALLREVDRICCICGIKYQIIAGTLLGAVRHGGYIPWDDDADVAMLRPEYERFAACCPRHLDPARYEFQDQNHTPGYRWGYGKLRARGTLFLRAGQEHMPYEQGIFIDIFPLDCVPDSYLLRCLKNFECFCVRKLFWAQVGKVAETNPFRRAVYQCMAQVPEDWLKRYFRRMIRRAARTDTKYVRILLFPTPNALWGYLRSWYQESAPYQFEGYTFPGIAQADAYLTFKYGDYRRLPPPKERKTHPVSALVLPGDGWENEDET